MPRELGGIERHGAAAGRSYRELGGIERHGAAAGRSYRELGGIERHGAATGGATGSEGRIYADPLRETSRNDASDDQLKMVQTAYVL